jgi:catechol 2,3-dioxygenase-like lactoylglutathione lyase family enzyme
MNIARLILRVTDMDRSVDFWGEKVGLDVTFEGSPFTFLDGGDVQLALNVVGGPVDDESLTEIVFEVEDVISVHSEMLERGVPFEIEPRPVTSDGERDLVAAHFRDPDGHVASITGWVDGG